MAIFCPWISATRNDLFDTVISGETTGSDGDHRAHVDWAHLWRIRQGSMEQGLLGEWTVHSNAAVLKVNVIASVVYLGQASSRALSTSTILSQQCFWHLCLKVSTQLARSVAAYAACEVGGRSC